ncbi:MAG: trypsin-like peptidase domain-containing protein [Paracoccaceae bacterium]|nr:trypsin-like peptidase domain-containing protein [Paracoccaceae bacterium]
MLRVVLTVLTLSAPAPAFAQSPAVLAAVGRLDLGGGSSCSGTLVAADLVLTAAHCLTGNVGETELDAGHIDFHPGRSPGLPPPDPIPGEIAAVHPIYGFGIGPVTARMGFDFGLLRLAAPVPVGVARPLDMGPLPEVGDAVLIAGYRGGQGEVARQRHCEVIEANHAFATLGCEVDGGESGSPMLQLSASGPLVVGVLANKGRIDGQPVAFGPVTETAYGTVSEHLRNVEALEIERRAEGLDAAN